MTHSLRLLAIALAASWLGLSRPVDAEEIKPPFGLHWGETTTRLERLLTGAKAKVVERRNVDGREAWEVEGILTNDLQRTVFYFTAGELVEVELQYKTDTWNEEKYNSFMGDVRRRLEQKYGPPELIARREEPLGEIIQKVVGWKWNQNNTGIELFYFSAQNAAQVFRTLSVHYKTY
ncbi:MAG: hypothetical protein QOE70_4885 [Chthoniobacter sp.]|jgi:hypothetical protein|nr:hypothetical protein [Chthoniobacter sp.]